MLGGVRAPGPPALGAAEKRGRAWSRAVAAGGGAQQSVARRERIRLARHLELGDVVAVAGELGAGKTTFIRGACRSLGVEEPVSSPTFTIGHRYEAPIPVAHLDLYRLNGISGAEWGDLEPYFDGTIAFVEWPEHAGGRLQPARMQSIRAG